MCSSVSNYILSCLYTRVGIEAMFRIVSLVVPKVPTIWWRKGAPSATEVCARVPPPLGFTSGGSDAEGEQA